MLSVLQTRFLDAAERIEIDGTLEFQLVESVPVETVLDMPDIANAPDVWQKMIEGANKRIDTAHFYFSNKEGSRLDRIVKSIREKTENGVATRIIFDKKLLNTYAEQIYSLQRLKGMSIAFIDLREPLDGVLHAKYWLIDGIVSYIGSQNFDWRSLEHIHEVGLLIKSQKINALLTRVFEFDYALATTGKIPGGHINESPINFQNKGRNIEKFSIVVSPPLFNPGGFRDSLPALIELIDSAEKSIAIQTLTYTTIGHDKQYRDQIDSALRRAAARNVEVRLLVSDWNLKEPNCAYTKSLAVLPKIEVKFSSIPPSSRGFIPFSRVDHAKYMLIDGSTCWIGTSNFEPDYYLNSRNIEVIFIDQANTAKLKAKFEKNWQSPYANILDPAKEYLPPKVK